MKKQSAVVTLSGGQDSTTCLYWALELFRPVRAVGFYYGQRHVVELNQAEYIAKQADVPFTTLGIPALTQIGGAALTNSKIPVDVDATDTGNRYAEAHGLPSTFVPGRNALFLTLAMALAVRDGDANVVTGVCEADEAGYPDCRRPFVLALKKALSLGLDEDVSIHAPLLTLTKGETFVLADELGVLDIILNDTHTCYHGDRSRKHPWGFGCGECGACHERAKGWQDYKKMMGAGRA